MRLEFEIPGKVKAKQSVKFANINGFMKKYTPGDITEYANWVKLCFMQKYPDRDIKEFADEPLEMRIFVRMKIPKSFSKKKCEMIAEGELHPMVKPDCDNIAKNICDALNGVAYPDDKQICCITVTKSYKNEDSVKVGITYANRKKLEYWKEKEF